MPWTSKQVRSIEWSRTYTWDFSFQDAPTPFNKLMPAITVNYPEWEVGSSNLSTTSYPSTASNPPTLSMTFYDSVDLTLYKWFRNWAKDITVAGMVLPVASAVKPCRLIKYKWDIKVGGSSNNLGGITFKDESTTSSFWNSKLDSHFGSGTSGKVDSALNDGLSGMLFNKAGVTEAYNTARSEVDSFYNKIESTKAQFNDLASLFTGFGGGSSNNLSEFTTNFQQSPAVGGMQILDEHVFLVYPIGTLLWEGGNESSTHQFTVEFAIAGAE